MASTGVDVVGSGEKHQDMEKVASYDAPGRRDSIGRRSSRANVTYDSTHRTLKPRHIQLIGIGCVVNHGFLKQHKSNIILVALSEQLSMFKSAAV
jgi:amino acid permease